MAFEKEEVKRLRGKEVIHKAPGVRITSYYLLFYDRYGIPINYFFTHNKVFYRISRGFHK